MASNTHKCTHNPNSFYYMNDCKSTFYYMNDCKSILVPQR